MVWGSAVPPGRQRRGELKTPHGGALKHTKRVIVRSCLSLCAVSSALQCGKVHFSAAKCTSVQQSALQCSKVHFSAAKCNLASVLIS
jgi:hypothetical protein